jgi:tetratricopeptide (TPR) repeat protein
MATKKTPTRSGAKPAKSAGKKKSSSAQQGIPIGMQAMRDLQRLLSKQHFASEQELEAFLNRMMAEGIPEFEPTTEEEQAEALVDEGFNSEALRAVDLARQALELDPQCIPAFDLLGRCEALEPIRAAYFKRGVDLGEERFGDVYRKKNEGHFWGLTETRPYMRCLAGYADSLFFMGDLLSAMDVWQDMLLLSSGDNLGVRYHLLLCMAALGEAEEFAAIDAIYADDALAAAYYNRALLAFTTQGPSPAADKALRAAMQRNPNVPALLVQADEPDAWHDAITLGSQEEALTYCERAWMIWQGRPGAVEWLQRVAKP